MPLTTTTEELVHSHSLVVANEGHARVQVLSSSGIENRSKTKNQTGFKKNQKIS
jgi:stalled ribosome rescue protein Dom34